MGLSNSRKTTLVVAASTLISNVLSSLLFMQLPDDPYHLARNFEWYLHFANVLSVFGFIGALRQNALSIAIFSNFLLLDTLLCAIPRFLIPILLNRLSTTLCSSTPSFSSLPPTTYSTSSSSNQQSIHAPNTSPFDPTSNPPSPPAYQQNDIWDQATCLRIVSLLQLALVAGVIAATVLQFVGALCVRNYAKTLWLREVREEKREERKSLCVERERERGFLPVIVEVEGESECEGEEKV